MADPMTSTLSTTKAPSLTATAENTPEVPSETGTDAEMVDSAPQWLVENDAWNYIHEEVQETAAAEI